MLLDVERFVPDDFESVSEARELLAQCGLVARRTHHPSRADSEEVLAADADERALFVRFVSEIDVDDRRSEPVRPYLRTLSDGEIATWKSKMADRWGVRVRSYPWYPLIAHPVPSTVVVVDSDYWWDAIVAVGNNLGVASGSQFRTHHRATY